MKAVLDEGVPRSLASALRAAGIETDPFNPSWKSLENGALIEKAENAGYTVLVTNDKNMAFQQSLRERILAVVALPSNRRTIVMGRIDDIADTIRRATPGRHILMNRDGTRISHGVAGREPIVEALPPVPAFGD